MNKSDLIKKIAEELDIPQVKSKRIVELFLTEILAALGSGEKVTLTGFGRFTAKKTKKRIRRNPKTGAKVTVPDSVSIRFKPSRRAKDDILRIFEHRPGPIDISIT